MGRFVCVLCIALALTTALTGEAKTAKKGSTKPAVTASDSFFERWHSAKELDLFADALGKTYKRDLKVTTVGRSAEKRPMKLLTLGASPSTSLRKLFVMGTIHGREWVSPASCLYLAYRLLQRSAARDEEVVELFSTTTVYILPLVNPDGYEYTRTPASKSEAARQWRKNRRNLCTKCERGVQVRPCSACAREKAARPPASPSRPPNSRGAPSHRASSATAAGTALI